jgi:hypothetical protein
MARDRHPLDDEFDMEQPLLDESIEGIEIPENAELRDIVNLSLKQYKDINDTMIYLEPSKRGKFLEIGHRYLKEANDALDRIEKNKIQTLKTLQSQKGKGDGKTSDSPSEKKEGTVSREELLEQRNLKRVK